MALAILGIGLGVILPGIGLALRLRTNAAEEARLAVAAEQVLGDLAARTKPLEGAEEGEIGGCRWQLEPFEATRSSLSSAAKHGAELIAVRLTLSSPAGPSWELTTLLPRGKPVTGP